MKKIIIILSSITLMQSISAMQNPEQPQDSNTEAKFQQLARLNPIVDWIKQPNHTSDFWDKYAKLLLQSMIWHQHVEKLEQKQGEHLSKFTNYVQYKESMADKGFYRSELRSLQAAIQEQKKLVAATITAYEGQLKALIQQFPPAENNPILKNSINIEDTYFMATVKTQ